MIIRRIIRMACTWVLSSNARRRTRLRIPPHWNGRWIAKHRRRRRSRRLRRLWTSYNEHVRNDRHLIQTRHHWRLGRRGPAGYPRGSRWAPKYLLARFVFPLIYVILITHCYLFRLIPRQFYITPYFRRNGSFETSLTKKGVDRLNLVPT